ncbi:MAG: hypothetical protein CME26_16695 [Gemmatimonadetes bacterium]|nr:hypothetical protein [Gemmatimonadota bacterium]
MGDDHRGRINAAIRQYDLALIGLSHAQPLWNRSQYERLIESMAEHAERMAELDQDRLFCGLSCSGKHHAQRSDTENDHTIEVWTELGEIFRSHDIGLVYHNHGEPEEDILFVLDNADPDLVSYCPDIDGSRVGGISPVDHIAANAERVTHVHLRDYETDGDRTVALGEGDLPFEALRNAFEEFDQAPDLIVELALPSGTPPDRPLPGKRCNSFSTSEHRTTHTVAKNLQLL